MPTVGVPLGPGGGGPLLHGLRLGDRRRRPATVLQILPRAAVDVRLPAQLSRPLQVALAVGRVAPIGQAAAVDPFGPARLLQRPVRRLLPRLAGRIQPVPGLGRPALARPATLRGLGVVPLEPLLLAARDPVIAALREHQVRVGVVRLVGGLRRALVEGERIGQPLPAAYPLGERARERRTRRLILIGSYIEHTTQADPAKQDRLRKGLDGFLERDQDRALFDLPPNT